MRLLREFLLLVFFAGALPSVNSQMKITSNQSKMVDYSIEHRDKKNKVWNTLKTPLRVTILQTGEVLDLSLNEKKTVYQKVKWQIIKGDDLYFEFYDDNPPPVTLIRSEGDIGRKTEFTVRLFIDDELSDEMVIYVTYKLEFPYYNSFERPFEAKDEHGRKQIAKYPTFSDDYINRSCGGSYPEYIDGKSVFTTYYSSLSRDTLEGSMVMTAPSSGQISSCKENQWELHNDSRVKRNDVNFYPHLKQDEDYYYSISLLVPNDERFPDEFLDSYYNILFEFHQDHHLDCQLSTGGSAPMHTIYTKNEFGDDVFRVNYGIEQLNGGRKDPVNKLKAVDIPYEKGKWIDIVYHVRWKQMYNKEPENWNWAKDGSDGLFEIWYPTEGATAYEKVVFGDPSRLAWAPFTYSNDSTTLYGPNLENLNPTYITFNQYRLPKSGTNVKAAPFSTTVYFDRFRIARTFNEATK